jgi:ubiquinone/menaquinone biosynthesis C-methylase UbiE
VTWLAPRLYDLALRGSEAACLFSWRAALLSTLSGSVLEIGAGTGLNLPHYTQAVQRLLLCEPDRDMRQRLLQRRDATAARQVEINDARAEALPVEGESVDAVVCTLVLCSVEHPSVALAEAWRVLKPGGQLVFLEHVAALDNPRRLRWQRRVEPIWKRVAGNCHLCRDTERAIRDAGFEMASIQRQSIRKAIALARPSIRGVAQKRWAT